jgi:histidyl-tRNA synthetase
LSAKTLKAQMKNADRLGAKSVVIIGDDELSRKEVTVRNMKTGEQSPVKIDRLIEYLQGEKG